MTLNEHPRIVGPRKYRYHSPLISAEWCSFTNFPWGRGLINFEPQEEALAMETYATWARMFELQRYYSWIVDRFHLSTRAYQLQTYGKDYDFRWLEERLLPLGFHIVLLTRTPESFEAARAERLKVSGNPSQYDDLDVFIEEQELMRRLAREFAASDPGTRHLRQRHPRGRRAHRRLDGIHRRPDDATTNVIALRGRCASSEIQRSDH